MLLVLSVASGCLRASTYLQRSEVTASQTTAGIIRGSSSGIIFHLFFPIIFMLVCISQHDMPIDTFLKDHFRYKHNHKCASWFVCVLCSSCIPVSHNIIYLLQMYIFMISLFFYFFQIFLDFHNQFFMYCLSRDWLAIRAKYPRTSSTIFCCLILSVASGCLRAYVCTGRTSLQVRLQQVLLEGVLVVLSC